MAILIIEHPDATGGQPRKRGILLQQRVLIGRRSICGLAVDHADVSRIHAWIQRQQPSGDFYIADAHSRTGTFRNGKPVVGHQPLTEGDAIQIGPATLRFAETDTLPPGVQPLKVSDDGTSPDIKLTGILFACHCGGPMWVAEKFAGAVGHCAFCHDPLRVPDLPGHAPNPTPQPQPIEPELCSVCQAGILPEDATTNCPSCGLLFHSECWHENKGCSAYGCPQVNALDPNHQPAVPITESADDESESIPPADAAPRPPFPWEFLLLLGSIIGSVLGAITFGAPACAVAVAAVLYRLRRRHAPMQARILAASIAVGCIGTMAGVFISRFWWFNDSIPGFHLGRR